MDLRLKILLDFPQIRENSRVQLKYCPVELVHSDQLESSTLSLEYFDRDQLVDLSLDALNATRQCEDVNVEQYERDRIKYSDHQLCILYRHVK
jgi:hypothetical protein